FDRLGLALDLTGSQFREGLDGPAVYTTWIGRVKANLNLSRAWSLRWIEQGDSYLHTVNSSALISWERTPGTALYLGYSEVWSTVEHAAQERSLFLKGSVLGRI